MREIPLVQTMIGGGGRSVKTIEGPFRWSDRCLHARLPPLGEASDNSNRRCFKGLAGRQLISSDFWAWWMEVGGAVRAVSCLAMSAVAPRDCRVCVAWVGMGPWHLRGGAEYECRPWCFVSARDGTFTQSEGAEALGNEPDW